MLFVLLFLVGDVVLPVFSYGSCSVVLRILVVFIIRVFVFLVVLCSCS